MAAASTTTAFSQINYSAISGNHSISGGGIYNGGTLEIFNSTSSGNTWSNVYPRNCGGILNYGTLTVVNNTIEGNTTQVVCCSSCDLHWVEASTTLER